VIFCVPKSHGGSTHLQKPRKTVVTAIMVASLKRFRQGNYPFGKVLYLRSLSHACYIKTSMSFAAPKLLRCHGVVNLWGI